jgi:hypothetical protein
MQTLYLFTIRFVLMFVFFSCRGSQFGKIRLHYVQQVLVQILPSEIHQETSPKKTERTELPFASGLLSRVWCQISVKYD